MDVSEIAATFLFCIVVVLGALVANRTSYLRNAEQHFMERCVASSNGYAMCQQLWTKEITK